MKITTTFEELQNAFKTVASTISESNLDSSMKNITLWVKRDCNTKIVCNTVYTSTYSEIETNVSFEDTEKEEEYFVQIQAKALINIFKTFSSLSRTRVDKVEFEILDKSVILYIHERGKEETDTFTNETKYQFVRVPVKPTLIEQIKLYDISLDIAEIDVSELNYYFDAALPLLINDDSRRWNNSLIFNKEKIYTITSYGGLVMTNTLVDKGFDDFSLKFDTIRLIKQFLLSLEKFKFGKRISPSNENVYLLVFVTEKTKIVERVGKLENKFRYELLGDIPNNGVIIDKGYLYDVLKRLALTPESVNVEINVTNGIGSMIIMCNEFVQNIPVQVAKGSGEFKFTIMPEVFGKAVMKTWKYNKEIKELFLFVANKEKGEVVLCVTDKTNRWYMMLPRLKLSAEFKKF